MLTIPFFYDGRGFYTPPSFWLGQTEQRLALRFGLNHLIGQHKLTYQRGNLLSGETVELGHTLDNLGAGHTNLILGEGRQELQDDALIDLILLLGLGLLLILAAVLAGQQAQLVVDEGHGILDGGAIVDGGAIQHSLDILETHGLGDTGLVSLFHNKLPFWFLGLSLSLCFIISNFHQLVKEFFQLLFKLSEV
nr:MAG TPA: hypothetical protein [Caudoviricetes sp.]